MRLPVLFLAGAAALAAIAMACGDDDDGGAAADQPLGDSGGAAGMTLPNTWLEWEGGRYQLTYLLINGTEASEAEFTEMGDYARSDLDADGGTLYRRAGDADRVWTFSEPTEDEPGGMWLGWSPEDPNPGPAS